ncbi:MAG: ABC transporter permease, partial [Alphaproteobacteria bacterium]|nr:ABC transporter permease [Alphaproteobacteria bacterium]
MDAAAGRRRLAIRLAQFGVGVALVLGWEVASNWLIDPFFISSPGAVFAKLVQWIERGMLLTHASYTFYATAVGFAIGAACGFTVGFAFGRSA